MVQDRRIRANPPTLPQELVDNIIDLLAITDDRTALAACALTSRRWTHRARVHLHHTLTLRHRTYHVHPQKHVVPTQRALDPAVRGALEHVRMLHVRGESSNLCFHTDVDACDSREAGELFWEVMGAVMEAAAERASVEKTMGRGRGTGLTVKLTDLYCGDAGTADTERLCAVLRIAGRVGAISHVEMADCEFRCPDELRRVLQACGTLETLKLDWIFWAHDTVGRWGIQAPHSTRPASTSTTSMTSEPDDEEGSVHQFGNLAHLQVGHCAHKMDERILKIFAASQVHPCVRRLSLGPTDLDIEMLPTWAHIIGASVEHLCLSFAQIGHPDVVKRVVGCLQHCPKLQKITLCATPWSPSRTVSSNPHFWTCALEMFRAALVHAQALEVVDFVWLQGTNDVQAKSAREEIQKLLAESQTKNICSRMLQVAFIRGDRIL